VSVTQTGEPVTLATLISERCRCLGLSQAEFVSRIGCQDIQSGIRQLRELFGGDPIKTKALIETIAAALDLPNSVVCRAAQVSQQLLDDRERRRFEVKEVTFPVLRRSRTINERRESAGSMVPYLRLISG
jgi:transcriptional regulator with XRE-family HTH domain